ncbi:MAG: hypothetical protein EPN68_01835 [Rhodanobacter sp.]|nr:MAG: hypothetical protein EPN68_01835 [Rhodanobacter sp.]
MANPGTLLGWPRDTIFGQVISAGQADFDRPIGHLSSDDRALLYADFNQRRHLDELSHAFRQLVDNRPLSAGLKILDLGCGPFTAGLSFAEVVGDTVPFRYFGVDRSSAMSRLGQTLADGARASGGLHELTSIWFGDNLANADFGPVRGEPTIIVASYLLASPTLDSRALVGELEDALNRVGPGMAAVLYTNSAMAVATQKYPAFKAALMERGFQEKVDCMERFTDTDKEPKQLHYALFVRPATTTIQIRKDQA